MLSHRALLSSAVVIAVIALGTTGWILGSRLTQEKTPAGTGIVSVPADMRGPFDLIDHTGRRTTEADFRGEKVLLYFGYTFCPDICPTSLQDMSAAFEALGPDGDKLRPVFITVDPDRDTQAHLADYVELFHERMVGLTGPKERTDAVARDFRVYHSIRTDIDPVDYPVDHSSYTYLMDEDWNLMLVFRHGTSPEVMAAAIKERL
ncbi:SCO family protein [Denitrobaculum tricleocarpae]|uniref:SCO family protein n=1 Tax=Denitrobaculum tricleocarpae TaxID=2591009 RepID=A0A545TPL9_9PROT|nr:SCO family protein [Denitrobaculum tricleocarpae]TQV79167.1 SCO family protein [Denitrobaculum tricleocarpae]